MMRGNGGRAMANPKGKGRRKGVRKPAFSDADREVFRLLRDARATAETGKDVWQFAVGLAELHAAGATDADLRRLVRDGQVECRVEVTTPAAKARRFRRWHSLALPARSCFVLTEAGTAAAAV